MDQPEEHGERARNTFFEQLLTVRMPTAGQATQVPSSPDAIAALDTAKQTTPPIAQIPIEQLPTARVPATRAPATNENSAISAPSIAPLDSVKARLGQRRRGIVVAVTAMLVIAVLTPMLYQFSASHFLHPSHTNGFAQGANPPAGWHPQDWAPLARQQAELNYVNQLIAHMTLDQEIGQMIMLGFLDTQMSPTLAYTIKQFHLGSVVLYAWNITGADQVKQLTAQMQSQADLPLFVATDQEGGSVNRLQAVDGPLPGAWAIAANGTTDYARQRGEYDAQQLYSLGINVNFAPVVDVANTSGGDLGGRTFGTTPDQVTRLAGAYLNGLQSSGHVVGTLKHFPGLGDVPSDPHQSLYTLTRSKADLERIDWAPYKALLATGQVQMIMSTHVVVAAIDPTRPASLSEPVLTGILRDELGYQGVIVTDGIYMGALTSHYSFDQIILDSVKAGNDIICSTYSIASTAETVRVLRDAVQNGDISKSRIDASVRRILLLKLHDGVLTMPQSQG
jgi:beta-N-acetylhexosaminidase